MLALLVVIGSLAAPMLDGSFARARLWHSGDLLRAAWTKARLTAMQSGQTHAFRAELRGGHYQLIAWDSVQATAGQTPAPPATSPPEDDKEPAITAEFADDCLPEGVRFASAQIAPSTQLAASQPDVVTSGWSPPILFYPDGTTSDASVLLADQRQQTLRVTLRGLTGIAYPGEIGDEAAP